MSDEITFKIACQGATTVKLDELNTLHHFKTLTDDDYSHCRNSLIENDFSFPFSIWVDNEGKKWTVDGHQRLQTLKRWKEESGNIPEEYPASLVLAESKELAAKKIIASESKYGEINPSDFSEFLNEYNIDWDDVELWANIPDLDTELWTGSEVTEDEPPAVDETQIISKLGEIYQLGRHKLMCGDATKIEDVEKLMGGLKADCVVTDPPYNTGMSKNDEAAWLPHMFKDNLTPEQWQVLIQDSLVNMEMVTKGECAFYVFIDWRNVGKLKDEMEKTLSVNNVIVWDKMVHGLGSDYKFTYEMVVVGKKGKPEINNRFGEDYRDVWHLQRDMGRNEDHATAKPLALLAKPISHASKQDDIVLDIFGGSGSTLIAAEQTNRSCNMLEIDPKYCDVIRKRYWKFKNNNIEDGWQENTPVILQGGES